MKKIASPIHPQSYQVSREGFAALREQLANVTKEYNELRTRLIELRQVKDAEEFDLVEESIRLSFLEKKVEQLQYIITHSKVVRASHPGMVQLGSKVRLEQNGTQLECVLVSALEADPSQGKISDQSPLGRALLGKMLHALVEVVAPRKHIMYRIVGIDS